MVFGLYFIFLRIAQKMLAIDPTVRTSMWWDLGGGKLTEIDYLNGAVVDEGKKLGIDKHITEVGEFLNERDLV